VLPGNHLGQNDGRITAIEEGKISLIEIVPVSAKDALAGSPGDLTLNVTAKTYRYLDEDEQAGNEAPADTGSKPDKGSKVSKQKGKKPAAGEG
jgi:hypothetical protein